ncbi:type II secretion system protein [Spirilliplanes yamanashiensis]|uniref:Prepilin-type N-terminal cleavage/methylation domain-containing protein n=1 Tax=Spirilliplanes yamanashiensis TaxID=42233 RepID=A0A8J3Y8H3_9ACTN|nr:type II secretion system protein [Spirilliplanes yamanashiensis]MDP9817135.1 prepilin-type N-terminal cleavage/methylation domain-containing protein [Spirilliplanes yamanashiensis]GIJ03212.1 hypothetical protein Sya03_25640 [Spirilliplanes yamanashiensis]
MVRQKPEPSDSGFTLLEVVVALALIGITMGAVGTFFANGLRTTHRQGEQQTAVQFAVDGVEAARMLRGPALVAGRTACTSAASCPNPAVAGATAQVGSAWQGRWDMGTSAARLAPPAFPDEQTVDNVVFQRRFYIRQCWAAVTGSGACVDTKSVAAPAPFYRVVVAVSWRNSGCAAGVCSYAVSGLFTGTLPDPIFETES